MKSSRFGCGLLLLSLSLSGCGQSVLSVALAEGGPQSTGAFDQAADETLKLTDEAIPATRETFTEPYPNRRDPFNPATRASAATAVRAESNDEIALRGFINVDGPRALLMINGKAITAEAGQQYSGFEVISIDPPSVTFQRGRNRWTTSLHP